MEQLGLSLATEIATIGFATKSAYLPNVALPLFDLEEGQISYGIGIHGEEGYRTVRFESSEQLANEIVNKLKLKFRWKEGKTIFFWSIILDLCPRLSKESFERHLPISRTRRFTAFLYKTGKFMTSLDMGGISVTLCRVEDQKWLDF